MISLVLAGLALQSAAPTDDASRDHDAIGTCALRSGESSSGPPKTFLAWQYDKKLLGPVTPDAVRIYDPTNILAGYQITRIGFQGGTLVYAASPLGTTSLDQLIVLGVGRTGSGGKSSLFGVVSRVNGKSQQTLYNGSCSLLRFQNGGSNAYFESLKKEIQSRAERGQ